MTEEDAEYEWFNPSVRRARKVHRRELTPLQATKTTVTVIKSRPWPPRWPATSENAAVSSHDPGEITLVRSVMIKTPFYCRENQSVDGALKIMREHGLPYLPVLDSNLRVVGVVSMRDLMLRKEQKDRPQSGE
jgi:CBS domain-containing protein